MAENNKIKQAKDWSRRNKEMAPIPVPAGYEAKYLYQLSAVCREEISADFKDKGGWGIISLETDHLLSGQEMDECQACFENEGATCLNDLRLIKQTFTYRG